MTEERTRLGRRGEDMAAEYLSASGWPILERNWRCREGEADIIAYDPTADALVVVEVKTRAGTGYGMPLDAITYAKARRLRHLAVIYARQRAGRSVRLRVDAIGFVLRPGRPAEMIHARGIEER